MEIKTNINYGKLKDLVKELSKTYKVKVGLLADKGGSDEVSDNLDMAGLGAEQEFGKDIKITQKMAAYLAMRAKELGLPPKKGKGDGYVHIPPRSFLQMPLTKRNAVINKLKERFGAGTEDIVDYIGQSGDLKSLAIMLGAAGVEVVKEAFQTNGDGQWAPNSPFTEAAKGSALPLRDTGNLESKITYEVEENG